MSRTGQARSGRQAQLGSRWIDGSDADVDEPTDDMEAEEEEPDADTAPNHTAGL